MKKILALLLVLTLLAVTFVGCTPAEEEPAEDPAVEAPADEEEVEEEEDAEEDVEEEEETTGEAGSVASFGLGQNISIAKSRPSGDQTAQAQADVTIAAVGFDEEGKVASVTIDVAQTRVAYDEDMQVTSDLEEEVPTKKELEDDYGMRGASEIDAEWYEQAEALEEWMIGKTVDEITGMEVKEVDEAHQHVPDVEELTSSVTITVEGYLEAVEEAWENREEVSGAETVGLGIKTSIAKSTSEQAQVDTTMAATAFDSDGNVAGAQIDVAQIRVAFDEEGQITTDLEEEVRTKVELGDDYGMVGASGIDAEWYEQMEALEDWMVGKSVDEITGMEVKEVDESHQNVPDVEELTSSVTITVESYLAVVEEAADNAK